MVVDAAVGVLALQGAVEPHLEKLRSLGVREIRRVLDPKDLQGLAGLILPGGESTAMLHLIDRQGLWKPLLDFVEEKRTWGVCAGSILLARRVSHPAQKSFGALDIDVERNAFGRQCDSFIAPLESWNAELKGFEGVFIRAPRIGRVGQGVEVLLTYQGEPVAVEQGNCMATTFHPELTDSPLLHQHFLSQIANA